MGQRRPGEDGVSEEIAFHIAVLVCLVILCRQGWRREERAEKVAEDALWRMK